MEIILKGALDKQHILVVEDDPSLADWICDYLNEHGFLVTMSNQGDTALELIKSDMPDLVVLDIMLPAKNGFDICREARAFYRNPILIITARTEETDEILGLELGADDYLCKPIKPRVLLARINALLRRRNEIPDDNQRVYGPVRLDGDSKSLFVGDRMLEVSVNEFEILWLLSSSPGEVISRNDLIRNLRGIDYDGFDRSMDIRISRLRKKLDEVSGNTIQIKTVRGRGYLFTNLSS